MKNVLDAGLMKVASIGLIAAGCLAALGTPAHATMGVTDIPALIASFIPTAADMKIARYNIKKYRENMLTIQVAGGMRSL